MIDPHLLRSDIATIAAKLAQRGFTLDTEKVQALDAERKAVQKELEDLQSQRNKLAKAIGQAKAKKEDASLLMEEAAQVADLVKERDVRMLSLKEQWESFLLGVPNLPHESTPEGLSEEENMEVRRWGEPRAFSFSVKDHADLGEALGILDFAGGAKLAGSRFTVLKGWGARLQRALAQFMLDLQGARGYMEISPPYMVNGDALQGTGQLPKFEEDLFALRDDPYYLIPTAEVPVTNMVKDEIVEEAALPLKFVAHTPCFRREAGSYGRDVKGMIRQHQFEKVELVRMEHPDHSYQALEAMCADAEQVLQKLELPYRVMALCAGDMGFAATKTYDLEVWLPSQERYREISSISNCEAFQSRRMKARFRPKDGKPQLLHTLNGSGLAIGRTLVALLENYQEEDGSVTIPAALQPYLGGVERIGSDTM